MTDAPTPPPLLEVRDLHVRFSTPRGEARAVEGASLEVREGETVGLVGESGSGKTVTALSILGLVSSVGGRVLPPSSVRFRGAELVGAPPARLRRIRGREIAMVFQEPGSALNPVMTIGAQLVETLRVHRRLARREAWSEGVRLLGEVGLPDPEARMREHPFRLSGGMRQRAFIALALAAGPRLLVADEPTTALDVTVQAQILDLLARLQASRGMGLLLVTHDLAVVAETCRRVVVLYGGQVVESGPVETVFRAPAHPYTRALLDAHPSRGRPGEPLRPIPGEVPDATAWPAGCRFHPRCTHVMDRCRREPPPLLEVD